MSRKIKSMSNSKRRRKFTTDGLQNVVSGIGTRNDKHSATTYGYSYTLSREELEAFYRNQWVAKAIDGIPFDMTRAWRSFCSNSIEPEQIKLIEKEEKRVMLKHFSKTALTWGDLYGGAAIIMHVDGQGNMADPLDPAKVKKGQLSHLTVVDRWMLMKGGNLEHNPLSKNFGEPEYYTVAWDTQTNRIHPSRVVKFKGRIMPTNISKELHFWGDSLVQRIFDAVKNNDTVTAGISSMVHEANIDIMKFAGLADQLMSEEGEALVEKRMDIINYCKSIVNMVALDKEDEYDRKPISFSALPEIQKIFLQIVAGATDYPIRRLLGEMSTGLSNDTSGNTRDYYDMINSKQDFKLEPQLNVIDEVLVRSALGDYPEDLEFKFNSLWQMTEKEEADLNSVRADTLLKLQQLGVPEESLIKDAKEQGLTLNLSDEDIEELSEEIEVDIDNEEEFSPIQNEENENE